MPDPFEEIDRLRKIVDVEVEPVKKEKIDKKPFEVDLFGVNEEEVEEAKEKSKLKKSKTTIIRDRKKLTRKERDFFFKKEEKPKPRLDVKKGLPSVLQDSDVDTSKLGLTLTEQSGRKEDSIREFLNLKEVDYNEYLDTAGGSKKKALQNYIIQKEKDYVQKQDPEKLKEELKNLLEIQVRAEGGERGKKIDKIIRVFSNGAYDSMTRFVPFSKELIKDFDKVTKSTDEIHLQAFSEEALRKLKPITYSIGKGAGELAGYSIILGTASGLIPQVTALNSVKWLPKLLKSERFGKMFTRALRFGITQGSQELLKESSDAISKDKIGIEQLTSSEDPQKRTVGRALLKAIKATGSGAIFGLLDVGGRKINALVGLAYGAINGMLQKGATTSEIATSALMFSVLNSATATKTVKASEILKGKEKIVSYLVKNIKMSRELANRTVDNTISSYIKNGANMFGDIKQRAGIVQKLTINKLRKDANALVKQLVKQKKIPVEQARKIVSKNLRRNYNIFFKQIEYVDKGNNKTYNEIIKEITDSQANKVNPLRASVKLKNEFSELVQNVKRLDDKGRRMAVDKFIKNNKLTDFRDDIQEIANESKKLLVPVKSKFGLNQIRDFTIEKARKQGIKNIAYVDGRRMHELNSAFGSSKAVDNDVFKPTTDSIKRVLKDKYQDLSLYAKEHGAADEFIILPTKAMNRLNFLDRVKTFKKEWEGILNGNIDLALTKRGIDQKVVSGFDVAVNNSLNSSRANKLVDTAKRLDKFLTLWENGLKAKRIGKNVDLINDIKEAKAGLQSAVLDEDTLGRGTVEHLNDIWANAITAFGKGDTGRGADEAKALFDYFKKNKKARDYIFDTINNISGKEVDTLLKRFSKQAFHLGNIRKATRSQAVVQDVKDLFKTMDIDKNPSDDLFSTFGTIRKENNNVSGKVGKWFSNSLGRLNKIYHTGKLGRLESLAYTVAENAPNQATKMGEQVAKGMFKNFTPAEKMVFTIYADISGKVGSKTAQKKAVKLINEFFPLIKKQDPNWVKNIDMKKIRAYTKSWDSLQNFLVDTSKRYTQGGVSMEVNQLGQNQINSTYKLIEDVLSKSRIIPSEKFNNLLLDLRGKTLTSKQFLKQVKGIKGLSGKKDLVSRVNNALIEADILKNTIHVKHTVKTRTPSDFISKAVSKITKRQPFTPTLASENVERRVETIESLLNEMKRKGGRVEGLQLDPERILSSQLSSYMNNISLFNFQKSLLKSNLIRNPNKIDPAVVKDLLKKGWVKMDIPQKGGFSSGYTEMFDGMLVEPATRVALSDLHDTMTSPKATSGISKFFMKVNGIMKMKRFFQFYRVISNDLVQMGMADPRAYGKVFKAFNQFKNNDKIYHELGSLGLYNQALYITEQGKKLSQMNRYLDPKLVKNLSGMDSRIKRFFKLPATGLRKFYETSGNLAWNGDKILRTAMFQQFKSNGLNTIEAVNRTQMFMAHYDRILTSQRRGLNQAFFVPTYRIQMARLAKELTLHPVKNRWAIFRSGLAKILLGASLAPAGFSVQQQIFGEKKFIPPKIKKFLPFLGYKYSRDLDDGKKEMLSFSSPLFEMDKVLSRPLSQTIQYNLSALPSAMFQLMSGKNFIGQPIAKRDDPLAIKIAKNLYFMTKVWFPPLELVERIRGDENKKLYRSLINGLGFANIYTLKQRGLDDIAEDLEGWVNEFNNSDFGDEDFKINLKKIVNYTKEENNLKGEGWDDVWKDSDKWR